ncbi:MAG: radical SAM family heme chaperone HemW, partial [Candidatus Hydrothermae bacterium]|nr:radical SAM family heme chaperone HemW [Candidatus Hydrothermae bacterium]
MKEQRQLGLYVHIPFCVRACPYCAHNKTTVWQPEDLDRYITALLNEAQQWADRLASRSIQTLYLGGGTPSLLRPHQMERLLQGLREIFPVLDTADPNALEVTVEMNPEHVTRDILQVLKTLGVNRVSLGVQSLIPEELQFLGRTHQPEDVDRAIDALVEADIPERSVDLIFGFQGQTLKSWENTLQTVVQRPLTHISTYELTLEPGTSFWVKARQGHPLLLPEAQRMRMYMVKENILEAAGFPRYEISNHARPGHASRHNLLYWRREDVIGLGAGATGQLGAERYINTFHVRRYTEALLQGHPPHRYREHLSEEQLRLEQVFLGLRLAEGLPLPPSLLRRAKEQFPDRVDIQGERL